MVHPDRSPAAPSAAIRGGIRLQMLVYALTLLLCVASGSLVVSPTQASTANPETIAASLVADPTCLRVTITRTGTGSSISTTFPERNLCDGGLVLVPGGTATRSGGGNSILNIPVRLLNLGAYAVETPAKLVLAPAGMGATVFPQNHDSLRAASGSWVWMTGTVGSVLVDDSTEARTLSVMNPSTPPVATAQLTFTVEAQQLNAGGWPLVFGAPTGLDTTLRVTVSSSSVEYLRRNIMLAFNPGVTDSSKAAFFTANQLVVLGVTDDGVFYLRVPDPGTSYSQYQAMMQTLRGSAEIRVVAPLVYNWEVDAQQLSPGGWPLLTDAPPALDATSLVTVPNTDITYYRRDLLVMFDDSITIQQQQAFFSTHNLTVLGVINSLGWFYVRTPDPGPTYSQVEAFRAQLKAAPGTKFVNHVMFDAMTPTTNSRIPADTLNRPR